MLEQLGLGIVLTFEDKFTQQSNNAINSMFKLQTQAEEMQQTVQKSLNNLQNVMLSGFSLNQIGQEFQNLGKTVVGTFKTIFSQIVQASSTMDTIGAQFKTIFGDKAQQKLSWAMDFSIKTPFDIQGTAQAMQKLSSVGLDVTKTFKNAKGEAKAFLQYVGDFATRNMGQGGGFEGIGIALQNAWSGQFRSIVQRFDIPMSEFKGMQKYAGKNAELFMAEFVKIAKKFTPDAMDNLIGTWDQTLAEMEDSWLMFMWKLGDGEMGGDVFRSIKKTLGKFSLLLTEFATDNKTIKSMGELFNEIWKPVDKIADALIGAIRGIRDFVGEHPKISAFIGKFIGFGAILSYIAGTFMRLTGTAMIFATSLVSAYANLSILKSLNLGGELKSVLGGFNTLGVAVKTLTLGAGLFGIAYSLNLMGVKDKVTELAGAFSKAGEKADALMSADEKGLASLTKLTKSQDVLSLKIGKTVAQYRTMKMIISDTFKGTKLIDDYLKTHNVDLVKRFNLGSFQQIVKKLPGLFDSMWKGFVDGLEWAMEVTTNAIGILLAPFKAIWDVAKEVFPGLGNLIDDFNNNMDSFKQKMTLVAKVAGGLLGSLLGFKVLKGLTSIITSPFKSLLGVLDRVGNKAQRVFSSLSPKLYGVSSKSMTKYTNIMSKREAVSSGFGRSFTEDEYRAMGLGMSRRVRNSGVAFNRSQVTQATGINFTEKQFRAMGLQYEGLSGMFKWLYKSVEGGVKKAGNGFVKSISTLNNKLLNSQKTGLLNNSGRGKYRAVDWAGNDSIPQTLLKSYGQYEDGDAIYAKRRTSLGRILLGDKLYKTASDGSKQKVAQRGGLLRFFKDDDQMRLASQKMGNYSLKPEDFKTYRDYVGYKNSPITKSMDLRTALTADKLKGYDDVVGDAYGDLNHRKSYINNNMSKFLGSGPNGAGQYKRVRGMSDEEWAVLRAKREKAFQGVLNSDGKYQEALGRANIADRNSGQQMYRAKRGKVSRALFGDRYYNIAQDDKGELYENTVARRGGIFRNRADDLVFKEEGNSSLRGRIAKNLSAIKGAVAKDFTNLTNSLKPHLSSFTGTMKSSFSTFGDKLKGLASGFKTNLTSSSMFSKSQELIGGVKSSANNFIAGIKNKASGALSGLSTRTSGFRDGISGALQVAGAKISNNRLVSGIRGTNTYQALAGIGSGAIGTIKSAGSNLYQNAKGGITSRIPWMQSGKGFLGSAFSGTGSKIKSKIPSFVGFGGKIGGVAKTSLGIAGKGASLLGRGTIGAVKGAGKLAGGAVSLAGGAIKGLGRGAMGLLNLATPLLFGTAIASSAVSGVKNMGANLDDKTKAKYAKQRGLDSKNDIQMGVAHIADKFSSFDFTKFWENFKKQGSKILPMVGDILKSTFKIAGDAIPDLFKDGVELAKTAFSHFTTDIVPKLRELVPKIAEVLGQVATSVGDFLKEGVNNFITNGLPLLTEGFNQFTTWLVNDGLPLIKDGLFGLADFFANEVVPTLLDWAGKFVDWFMSEGVPALINYAGQFIGWVVSNLPSILSKAVELLGSIGGHILQFGIELIKKVPGWAGKIGGMILEGIKGAVSRLGSWISGFFKNMLGKILTTLLPDVLAKPVASFLGIDLGVVKHHGGLYLSPDEHQAIIQAGETVLPRDKSKKLDDLLEGKDSRSTIIPSSVKARSLPTANQETTEVNISNLEIIVKSEKLSAQEAREQALNIVRELKKLKKEKKIRNNDDITIDDIIDMA